ERQVGRLVGNELIDERVRLAREGGAARVARIDRHRFPPDVFDDEQVSTIIGVDSFITAFSENAVQRSDRRWPVGSYLDDAAARPGLLGEEESASKRIPGRTVDRSEAGCPVGGWRQQRDSVRGVRYVQIDTGDIRSRCAVFMTLEEKMTAVLVARRRASGIVI